MSDEATRFNQQAALARVAGDEDLLREIAALYLENAEDMMQGVRDAVAAGDAEALRSAAHYVKGTVANFDATAATAAASDLEQMGKNGDLDGAEGKLAELEREAAALAAELDAYCRAR